MLQMSRQFYLLVVRFYQSFFHGEFSKSCTVLQVKSNEKLT